MVGVYPMITACRFQCSLHRKGFPAPVNQQRDLNQRSRTPRPWLRAHNEQVSANRLIGLSAAADYPNPSYHGYFVIIRVTGGGGAAAGEMTNVNQVFQPDGRSEALNSA